METYGLAGASVQPKHTRTHSRLAGARIVCNLSANFINMPAPRSKRYRLISLILCTFSGPWSAGQAAEEWPPYTCPSTTTVAPRPAQPDATGLAYLHADRARALQNNIIELEGSAEVRRDGQQIDADYLRYDRAENYVEARGNVTVIEPDGTRYRTGVLQLDLDTRAGEAGAGHYRLPAPRGRGTMEGIEFVDRDHTRLRGVRYSTCPEGREDWYLRARRVDLDTTEDIGVARDATLRVFGAPVFYLPYFSFPISDKRKSGFLIPQVGYSGSLGAIVAAPYYLNLAPNYDATLTPRWMTRRGLQLQSEFRYLGGSSAGQLDVEYLPNDKVTGENRAAGSFIHNHVFTPTWTGFANVRGVSDRDYVNDFGERLAVTSEAYLPQNAEVNYRGSAWNFTARAADYQTVDRTVAPASRPYARLPQLLLSGDSGPTSFGAQYRLDSELVNFYREVGITGQRANVAPVMRLPLTRVYGFLIPEVGARYIGYSLDNAAQARPSVTVPFASLDTGLYFEREVAIGSGRFDQTLEPRLYYLYVPHREQDQLPNFDTAIPDFTFANLFRNNRFVGGDRLGDANQVTAALTTRFIDQESGAERASASIGRVYYLEERRVNLPPGIIDTHASDFAAEGTAWLGSSWQTRATLQWSQDREQAVRSTFYLQYQPAESGGYAAAGYRYSRNELEQVDLTAAWPLSASWRVRARSLYSLRDIDRGNIESSIGAEYRDCCWAVRLYAARTLVQTASGSLDPTEQRNQFQVEFELIGLSGSNRAF